MAHDETKRISVRVCDHVVIIDQGLHIPPSLKKFRPRNWSHARGEEMGIFLSHFRFQFPGSVSRLMMLPKHLNEGNGSIA